MSVWRYLARGHVLAEEATKPGRIITPQGVMSYEAGDYLLTDSPPTHIWPVKREIFERTYAGVSRAWPTQAHADAEAVEYARVRREAGAS